MIRKLKRSSRTWTHLMGALSRSSVARMRFEYFALRADGDGETEVAAAFRDVGRAHEGLALEIFELLKETGDDHFEAFGAAEGNLEGALKAETYGIADPYPGFARRAREEGYVEIAEWFEVMARAEHSHRHRLRGALDRLGGR